MGLPETCGVLSLVSLPAASSEVNWTGLGTVNRGGNSPSMFSCCTRPGLGPGQEGTLHNRLGWVWIRVVSSLAGPRTLRRCGASGLRPKCSLKKKDLLRLLTAHVKTGHPDPEPRQSNIRFRCERNMLRAVAHTICTQEHACSTYCCSSAHVDRMNMVFAPLSFHPEQPC